MSDSTAPPLLANTPDDHGTPVSIVNCLLIILTGLVVIARAATRLQITKLKATDDIAIHLALLFAIAQSVCMQLATNHGIGKHRSSLSAHDFNQYSKFFYASQILTVVTLTFAKFAISQLILAIQPKRAIRLISHGVDAIILLWTISSIFALAFQCDLPHPWILATKRCVNLEALYDYVGVLNILTDAALILLPITVVWGLQLHLHKKALVLALFLTRILVPAAAITQLACLPPFINSLDADQTWHNVIPSVINQIMVNVSVMTACVPSLRRVVTDIVTHQTGLMVSENLELTFGGTSKYGKDRTLPSQNSKHSQLQSGGGGTRDGRVVPYGHNKDNDRIGNIASIYALRGEKSPSRQSSEERLREEGIHYTVEVTVEEDERGSTISERRHEPWSR